MQSFVEKLAFDSSSYDIEILIGLPHRKSGSAWEEFVAEDL